MINEDLDNFLLPILEKIAEEDLPEIWKNAKYLQQRMIQIDKRGSVGERFFAEVLLRLYPRRIEYNDGDQGDWDLKINKIKFEIKTSTLGKDGKKFQNESIKKDGDYDGLLFLGIAPNDLYIRFIKKTDIDFEKQILNIDGIKIKLHHRAKDNTAEKATGAGYKMDFTLQQMIAVKSLQDIKAEFEKCFINNKNLMKKSKTL